VRITCASWLFSGSSTAEKTLVAEDLKIALAGQGTIDQGAELLLVQLHLLTDQVGNLAWDLTRASRPPRCDDSPAVHKQTRVN
jgi:hypothetical protein